MPRWIAISSAVNRRWRHDNLLSCRATDLEDRHGESLAQAAGAGDLFGSKTSMAVLRPADCRATDPGTGLRVDRAACGRYDI